MSKRAGTENDYLKVMALTDQGARLAEIVAATVVSRRTITHMRNGQWEPPRGPSMPLLGGSQLTGVIMEHIDDGWSLDDLTVLARDNAHTRHGPAWGGLCCLARRVSRSGLMSRARTLRPGRAGVLIFPRHMAGSTTITRAERLAVLRGGTTASPCPASQREHAPPRLPSAHACHDPAGLRCSGCRGLTFRELDIRLSADGQLISS